MKFENHVCTYILRKLFQHIVPNASRSSNELENIYAVFESQELTQTFAKTFKPQYFILCAYYKNKSGIHKYF